MREVTMTGMKHNGVEWQVKADFPLILLDEGEVAVKIANLHNLMEMCPKYRDGKCHYNNAIVRVCSLERCPVLEVEGF